MNDLAVNINSQREKVQQEISLFIFFVHIVGSLCWEDSGSVVTFRDNKILISM